MDFLPQIDIKIAKNLAKNAAALISQHNFSENISLISDENIWANCERFFNEDFQKLITQKIILKDVKADDKNLERIEKQIQNTQAIIAIGSGSINDLCKLISAKKNIPYIIFASAPSMNGYLSKNASITINGHKKTLPAVLAKAVFADFDILQTAPQELIKAGIGDSLCFYSCKFDWLLSHLILNTKFDEKPFAILQEKMDFLVNNYQKFSLKDEEFLKNLIEILFLSGAGMTYAQGSYPASQSEHLIAHAIEMKYDLKILHGLLISITTITSAKIQENLLKADKLSLNIDEFFEEKLIKIFDAAISLEAKNEYLEKINFDRKKINETLKKDWVRMRTILHNCFLSAQKLQQIFTHFEINTDIAQLSLTKNEYVELVDAAKLIRNRFTCLDVKAL